MLLFNWCYVNYFYMKIIKFAVFESLVERYCIQKFAKRKGSMSIPGKKWKNGG